MKRFVLACLGVVAVVAGDSVAAHHSTATYDHTVKKTLSGTVVEFGWTNPHAYIQVDVANESGGTDRWAIAMGTPTSLVRSGWKSTLLKPGDRVTVVVNPLKNGDHGGWIVSITLPDGRTLGTKALE